MSTSTKSPFELAFQPIVLTAIGVLIGGALAAYYSLALAGLYFGAMPVALVLLWASRGVTPPIERIAQVDAEHARAVEEHKAPAISRAA